MEHNLKIQNLLKKGMFPEAQSIAISAKFPKEIQAEICKEHADTLYTQKKEYDQALEQYINTIGYLNPSYVIQRYIEVQQLPNLIKYLEKLIETPTTSSSSNIQNVNTLGDYNKDYTALLLNCYVKMK
jgi:vacuolar protein sorting-associated protein 11|tara:strand:- start:1659 stop:2042 length:384 start_codon:yes stop_codon:yes gene_type:complete